MSRACFWGTFSLCFPRNSHNELGAARKLECGERLSFISSCWRDAAHDARPCVPAERRRQQARKLGISEGNVLGLALAQLVDHCGQREERLVDVASLSQLLAFGSLFGQGLRGGWLVVVVVVGGGGQSSRFSTSK